MSESVIFDQCTIFWEGYKLKDSSAHFQCNHYISNGWVLCNDPVSRKSQLCTKLMENGGYRHHSICYHLCQLFSSEVLDFSFKMRLFAFIFHLTFLDSTPEAHIPRTAHVNVETELTV